MSGSKKAKKVVFVAHPIKGDIEGNLQKVREICKKLFEQGVIPMAPCLAWHKVLDDNIPEERALGIEANRVYFEKKAFDELGLYGERISESEGVCGEIKLAHEFGILVVPKTPETHREYEILKRVLMSAPQEITVPKQ